MRGLLHYYADNAYVNQLIATDTEESYITFDPLGPVLAIMPSNFSFWQAFRFAAPALIARKVGVFNHASNVSSCALVIQDIR